MKYLWIYISDPSGRESVNYKTLILTGCSRKAIRKHAGLLTAQLQQESQQQVVKAKVSVILIQQHQITKIRYRLRWGQGGGDNNNNL